MVTVVEEVATELAHVAAAVAWEAIAEDQEEVAVAWVVTAEVAVVVEVLVTEEDVVDLEKTEADPKTADLRDDQGHILRILSTFSSHQM